MLAMVLLSIGAALNCIGGAGTLMRSLTPARASALCCVGAFLAMVGAVLDGSTWLSLFWAAASAFHGWLWWNGGGGDDTKRRLRRWGRRFQGVRRTAPQGA